jgi:expansin (peptidoglycan-binding protein)
MNTPSHIRTLVALAVLAIVVAFRLPAHADESRPPAAPAAIDDNPIYLPGVFAVITSSISPAPPLPFDPNAVHSGEGTYYNANGGGNCSFDPSPGDLMVAALNTPDYHDSLLCGAYIEVTGPNGSVVVRVVDRCPECPAGDVDMSQQAFERIAALVAGRVPITWRLLSPALSGPIAYRFKEGSNQWWTAVQIRNHRNPIYSVEARASDGSFYPLERQSYNYFVAFSGLGVGPVTLRVTDIYGNTITDSGIGWAEAAQINGSAQFPPAP